VTGLWTGILLIGFDLYAALITYIPQYLVRNDFRLIYGAAEVALQSGFSHLYDLDAQKAATEAMAHGVYWQPFLNPPPLVWLATPFTALRFDVAIWMWTALLAASALLAWYLTAPGGGLARAAHLALFLGLFPTAFGLMVGQPVALVAAAVAGAWWFAERRWSVASGLALSVIAIKPQLALLVPLCLLFSGHARIFVVWLVATAVMVLAAAAMLGPEGINRYRDVLALASQWEPTRRYAIDGPLGTGPHVYVIQAVVVAVAIFATWRQRNGEVARPVAIGLVASLLFTPYVGFQDFAMLVIAGWLVIRARASAVQVGILVIGYALLELALMVLAVPILVAEACLLVSLMWPAAPGNLRRLHRATAGEVPPEQLADSIRSRSER
jgi:hypothetical protein